MTAHRIACPHCAEHCNVMNPYDCPECGRLRAALEMLAQARHISGSAQATSRFHLRLIDAVLAGADARDPATVEAIAAGTWK